MIYNSAVPLRILFPLPPAPPTHTVPSTGNKHFVSKLMKKKKKTGFYVSNTLCDIAYLASYIILVIHLFHDKGLNFVIFLTLSAPTFQ